jgi:hypothetical protein
LTANGTPLQSLARIVVIVLNIVARHVWVLVTSRAPTARH